MPNKLQFKLEIIAYYFRKNILYILSFIVAAISVYIYLPQIKTAWHRINPPEEIIGIEGFYTASNLPYIISSQLSYGLTSLSENGKTSLSPITESIVSQNDNLEYLVTLRPGVTWSNGKKLIASDIDLQINGLQIEAINQNQLKITTSSLFSPILSLISKPIFSKNLVGLTDYKVSFIDYQDGFIKKMTIKSAKDNHLTKTYIFYPSESDLINAFKLGEIREALNLSSKDEFALWPNVKITPQIQSNQKYIAIFLNTEILNNKQLRQALAYATPKTNDKNERCLGPISPNSWAYNSSIKEYNFNSIKAKEFFENNKIDSISLTVTDRRLLSLAENIKNTWQEVLGLSVTLSIENQIDINNYESAIAYASIPQDPDQYAYWHSTQVSSNITKLNNSRIDKLLEEGRQVFDPIERKDIYYEFQRFLLEESPAIFISYPTTFNVTKTN